MRAFSLAAALTVAGSAHAQSPTPADHPGFVLAEAIAARGCVLHQDDVNALLADLGLTPPDFPRMALPLIQDGTLASTGNGTLTLVNWGLCTGLPEAPVAPADAPGTAAAPGVDAADADAPGEGAGDPPASD